MFKVNSKDTRTKPIEGVAVCFGVNQTQNQTPEPEPVNCKNFYRAAESQIEMKYKQKLKIIVYFEQILQRVLVFLLLTLNR